MGKKTAMLRALLDRDEVLRVPGCYDALGARVLQSAGFEAVCISGSTIAASAFGRPDIGLITASEVIERSRSIASTLDIPAIADADTGYGNLHNAMRTVEDFESAGIAGIHLEDQVTPKRCGAMSGVQVIPVEESVIKLEAALKARRDPDFVIIARTDARTAIDLDEAISRANTFADVGVDMVYIEGLRSYDEIVEVSRRVKVPKYFSVTEYRPWTNLPLEEIKKLGFAAAMYPMTLTLIITRAMMEFANHLKEHSDTREVVRLMADREADYDRLLAAKAYRQIEAELAGRN